jgi:cell fate regulator YaaT (PSP1 superfamily)
VNTTAARYQQLALNPVKLAGQCGKLKCCLNYELDTYLDALKDFPQTIPLETHAGRAIHQKTDIFKRTIYYAYTEAMDTFIPLSVERVKHIIELNRAGKKPQELDENKQVPVKEVGYVVGVSKNKKR